MKKPLVKFDTRFTTGIQWTGYLIQRQRASVAKARAGPPRFAVVVVGAALLSPRPTAVLTLVRAVAAAAPALLCRVAAAVTTDVAPCNGCCCRCRPGAPSH